MKRVEEFGNREKTKKRLVFAITGFTVFWIKEIIIGTAWFATSSRN
jgi:hypothetical protein